MRLRLAVKKFISFTVIIAALILPVHHTLYVSAEHMSPIPNSEAHKENENVDGSWIVRWNAEVNAAFIEDSVIMRSNEQAGITVAKPKPGVSIEHWLQTWSECPDVLYLTPNEKVSISAVADDPFRSVQNYLDQIKANDAWDIVRNNTNITIAVIDTGVDLHHEDLKANLVQGKNLIDEASPPQDDHGHGTNVAGIIGAIGNNKLGLTGIVWNTKLMPIKAIEADGYGDVDKLGEGIRYAVDHGANIIVLSLGLYNDSPYMREVVEYAEEHDALLIAATGNDGANAVKYPAAYPTVLAVGGVTSNNQAVAKSNYGPEVDVVAPWDVIATALNGDYVYNEGTSMAAPQAAGAAALALAKYPHFKPYEIRNLIRQTALDIESRGFDHKTGYGLLRVDRVVNAEYKVDMYEPNNQASQAKPLPLGHMISAELSGGGDEDWYTLETNYNGTISLDYKADKVEPIKIIHHINGEQKIYDITESSQIDLDGRKGKSLLQIKFNQKNTNAKLGYRLTASFHIAPDQYESNDRQFQAYQLSSNTQNITGNFHKINDQDWYAIDFKQSGSLQLKLSVDTKRINPAMIIQKLGEKPIVVDYEREGKTEYSDPIDILPGKYYILVSNVVSDQAAPVAGEYQLNLNYTKKFVDPYEPNNKAFQATSMMKNITYRGVFEEADDVDWFKVTLNEDSYVTFQLKDIPEGRYISLSLLNQAQERLNIHVNKLNDKQLAFGKALKKGTYYVRLTSNMKFNHQMYQLSFKTEKLLDGYRDIQGHWSSLAIVELSRKGYVKGYEDSTFRPDAAITRAEAASLLARALNLQGEYTNSDYSDVGQKHWASNAIQQAKAAGIITGYEDGTFKPNRNLTRAEMAVMLAGAMQIDGITSTKSSFHDVPAGHWAAPMIEVLHKQQYISGFTDGSFKPNQAGTRAEFIWMLYQMIINQR